MSGHRPEWMPRYEELEWDRERDTKSPFVCPNADKRHAKTGLRAQIAVLEEMQKEFGPPDGCWTGEDPAERQWVRERIATLRKELEHG